MTNPPQEGSRVPIEELIEFPTRFVFKAVGHHTLPFPGDAHSAMKRALGGEREVEMRTRLSSKGTYLSVTLTATVESPAELAAAYAALRQVAGVLTVL